MDLFYPPIYQLVFKKIIYMEKIVEELGKLDDNAIDKVNSLLEPIKSSPLEEQVGSENIRDFIKHAMERSQMRFGLMVEILLKDGIPEEDLTDVMYKLGKRENFVGDAREAYARISEVFLDGLPDERGTETQILSEDHVKFELKGENVREMFTENDVFKRMGDAWMDGFLERTGLEFINRGAVREIKEIEK